LNHKASIMHIAVLVNDPAALAPGQTTTMLIHKAAQRGHTVDIVGVNDLLGRPDSTVQAQAVRVPTPVPPLREALVEAVRTVEGQTVSLNAVDVLLMRTNPARDERSWAHAAALSFAGLLEAGDVLVLNRPEGLLRSQDKLYLQRLPSAVRPRTLVSRDVDVIRTFIDELDGPAVLKPLQGTRGTDVFFAYSADDRNLHQIVDVLARQGLPMVQEYLPEAAEGDTRVVVMNGDLLKIDAHPAAIRRVPARDDFRSNLHVGGTAKPATITPAMHAAIEAVGPLLRKDGLFLVGLDFIGDKIIEVNTYSTGGLRDAERFEEVDFCAAIVDAIGQCVEQREQ
jgi:glutathione synthase